MTAHSELINRMEKAAAAVFLVTAESVANDLSGMLLEAIAALSANELAHLKWAEVKQCELRKVIEEAYVLASEYGHDEASYGGEEACQEIAARMSIVIDYDRLDKLSRSAGRTP